MYKYWIFFLNLVFLFSQENLTPYKKHFFSFITQNDAYVDPFVDQYYTAGHSLYYASSEGSYKGLDHFGLIQGATSFSLILSQSIYAPKAKFETIPPSTDHPYAGFLNLTWVITHRNENFLENLGLKVGVIGEIAFGREVQNGVHQMLDVGFAKGWDTQLANEGILNLYYDLTYKHTLFDSMYFGVEVLPNVELAFGNANIYAKAGATLKMGYHLQNTFLPQGITGENGGLQSGRVYQDGIGFFGFIGANVGLVVRNAFIQGNLFAKHPRLGVDLIPCIGSVEAGISLVSGIFSLSYKAVYTTKEFSTQDKGHWIGSLALGVSF